MIKLNDRTSIRSQVTDYYRKQIRSGALKEGSMLPPARRLAVELGTAEANIHHALATLAKEGLIVRRPKRGSVVLPQPKLSRVAFYMNSLYCMRGERFTQPLIQCLEKTLSEHNIQCQVIYDTIYGEGLRQLTTLAETHQIQGVILRSLDQDLFSLVSALPIPFSAITSMRIPNGVNFFGHNLAEKAILAMKEQGCKTLGLLYPGRNMTTPDNPRITFPDMLRNIAEHSGLSMPPENIYDSQADKGQEILDVETFAYRGMKMLLDLPERPDGILAFSDDLVSGITMALYERKIRVPEDIKFIIHRTVENPVVFPFPTLLLESSIQELVHHLTDQLIARSEGRRSVRKILACSVRKHAL